MTEEQEENLKVLTEAIYKRCGDMTEKEILLNVLIKLEEGNIIADKSRIYTLNLLIWLVIIPLVVAVFLLWVFPYVEAMLTA